MTTLVLFFEHPMMRSLGWSLLHFVWEGAIVGLLLACVLGLLHGRSPQLRYAIACGALVLLIALPALTFAYLAMTSHVSGDAATHSMVGMRPLLLPDSGVTEKTDYWLDEIATSFDRLLPWMLTAWFAGVVFLLGRLNLGLMVAQRMRLAATHTVPDELQRVFDEMRCSLGVSRTAKLLNSALVNVPTVIGWLRPAVLLPVGCWTGLSTIQIEAIFAHELAHIRRHDYLVNILQSFVESMLFYHPAVWWVSKQVRRERENCCDDIAVRMSGDSFAYAKALSYLEEHRSSLPVVALGANGGVLVMRIRRLLGYKEAPAFSRSAGVTLLAMVVVTAALCVSTFARAQSGAAKLPVTENSGAVNSLSPIYQNWLDQDVLWIITPAERAQFMSLSNDSERDAFITQFWQSRSVGEANFKQQHYQRLAYANQHFGADKLGWRTDRGRIYILHGPPSSVDSHPAGDGGSAKSYEVWHYRGQEMTFVDDCSCGEYRLQASPR